MLTTGRLNGKTILRFFNPIVDLLGKCTVSVKRGILGSEEYRSCDVGKMLRKTTYHAVAIFSSVEAWLIMIRGGHTGILGRSRRFNMLRVCSDFLSSALRLSSTVWVFIRMLTLWTSLLIRLFDRLQ
jgi:hypothetical protein